MLLTCDKPGIGCNQEFEGEVLTESVIDDIERLHLKCPHCGTDYTLFYTSDWIKRLQASIRKWRGRIAEAGNRPDFDCQKKWNKIHTLEKMITGEMHRLKEIHGEAE